MVTRTYAKAVSHARVTNQDVLRRHSVLQSTRRGSLNALPSAGKDVLYWVTFSPAMSTAAVIDSHPFCGLVLHVLHDDRVVIGDVRPITGCKATQKRIAITDNQVLYEGDELVLLQVVNRAVRVHELMVGSGVPSVVPGNTWSTSEHSAQLVAHLSSMGIAPSMQLRRQRRASASDAGSSRSEVRYVLDVDAALQRAKQFALTTQSRHCSGPVRAPVADPSSARQALPSAPQTLSDDTAARWESVNDPGVARDFFADTLAKRVSDWQTLLVTTAMVKGRCFANKYPGNLVRGRGQLMLEPHAHPSDPNALQVLDCSTSASSLCLPCAGYVDRDTAAFVSESIKSGADVEVEYVGSLTDERGTGVDMLRLLCAPPPPAPLRSSASKKRTRTASETNPAAPVSSVCSPQPVAALPLAVAAVSVSVPLPAALAYVRVPLDDVSIGDDVMGHWSDLDGWFPGVVESIDRRRAHPYRVQYSEDFNYQWLSDAMIGARLGTGAEEAVPQE
jgi:hypothetical protein